MFESVTHNVDTGKELNIVYSMEELPMAGQPRATETFLVGSMAAAVVVGRMAAAFVPFIERNNMLTMLLEWVRWFIF